MCSGPGASRNSGHTKVSVNHEHLSEQTVILKAFPGMCADVGERTSPHEGVELLIPVAATLRLFPGITAASARSFLSPPIKGVVLESFGAG